METPQLVDKIPQRKAKKKNHAIGNRQHDDVQNERSLGTNLSQLNENENG